MHHAPAVPRLGILAYDWWNETLHGVARTPFSVTSYPQAIGMAATWDTSSLRRMGDFSATEGRAIHNKAIALGKEGDRYLGLTYWTPNINIFRDPRWGRGQETYGEDPYLTALLGAAIVQGLQGDDPNYLKSAACAKHFAVHSGPESSRHSDNFNPSPYDLWDTYLPAFKELIVNAKVAGVMCAYNAMNNQPCCANNQLMNDILRRQWKFTGYVTSDCWALDDFFRYHKTHKDAVTSAVDALIHTTDLECGNTVYSTLVTAVKQGLVKESDLDISLKRLFTIRFQLGMFDPPERVPYAQTPITALEAPAHKAHALKMARQSIVLLKNQNNTLPLNRHIKKIAVIGPNADNKLALLGNYNGMPSKIVTVLEGLKEKLGGHTEVHYEKAINYANDTVMVYNDISHLYQWNEQKGVQAEYFNNTNLEGQPVLVKLEKDIDHFWSEGQPPAEGVHASHYSIRFTTTLFADKNEALNFETDGDDGYRVRINGKTYVDAWEKNKQGAKQFQLNILKGNRYQIVVEYFQNEGNAIIRLKSGTPVKTDFEALAERLKTADAIIFVGGISPQLEGEEMKVSVAGFAGGDRTSIALPRVQTDLMKVLKRIGKPLVFVMMTGSAIASVWEDQNVPAIVNAWYGGQSGGTAIADVLFGDYNPAGRLPVTFYKSDADLPDFKNYDMQNRTYRYFKGKPLYPFGFGLSYTTFRYHHLVIPTSVRKGQPIFVSVQVTNSGQVAGDEVAQIYISWQGQRIKAPIRALKGFERFPLNAGETKEVRFELTPEQLSLVDALGNSFQPGGKITISVGGGQPGVLNKTTSNVVTRTVFIR